MEHNKLFLLLISLILPAIVAISGCTAAAGNGLKAGLPDNLNYKIEVTGSAGSPVTLTYADIVALGLVEEKNVSYVDDAGLIDTGDFVGVPMAAILARAGVPEGNSSYNISAADGESALYSGGQADKAILALKRDGVALMNNLSADPIHLVLPGGPFCHWIDLPTRIEVVPEAGHE